MKTISPYSARSSFYGKRSKFTFVFGTNQRSISGEKTILSFKLSGIAVNNTVR
jgi:hypothetical protein